jgi:hypothetical protein
MFLLLRAGGSLFPKTLITHPRETFEQLLDGFGMFKWTTYNWITKRALHSPLGKRGERRQSDSTRLVVNELVKPLSRLFNSRHPIAKPFRPGPNYVAVKPPVGDGYVAQAVAELCFLRLIGDIKLLRSLLDCLLGQLGYLTISLQRVSRLYPSPLLG